MGRDKEVISEKNGELGCGLLKAVFASSWGTLGNKPIWCLDSHTEDAAEVMFPQNSGKVVEASGICPKSAHRSDWDTVTFYPWSSFSLSCQAQNSSQRGLGGLTIMSWLGNLVSWPHSPGLSRIVYPDCNMPACL